MHDSCDSAAELELSFELVSSASDLDSYRLTNLGSCSVLLHSWIYEDAGPVVYCKDQLGDQRICSKTQYWSDFGAGPIPYDSYERLDASASIDFSIDPIDASFIGIKFYGGETAGGEVYWARLDE